LSPAAADYASDPATGQRSDRSLIISFKNLHNPFDSSLKLYLQSVACPQLAQCKRSFISLLVLAQLMKERQAAGKNIGRSVQGGTIMLTNKAALPQTPAATALRYLGVKQYQLSMEGRFDPGWICGLSHGLAEQRVNIIRVEALRGNGRNWQARLDLDFSLAGVGADAVDYQALSKASPTVQALSDPLVLDDYQLERSNRCGGSLYLEASGHDRLGVLSSLLNTFSLFSLFPAEILVETKQKRIFDRFWLKGLGNSVPSPEAIAALRQRMQEVVQ
jgi:hypothetical protein